MKIGLVEIFNMRNYEYAKFCFKDLNYIHGDNGVGKSTILQAIQLGLLGYIPGYGKKNNTIFMHSNASSMKINLVILDNSRIIEISREFFKSKDSITCNLTVTPDDVDIKHIIGNIELPVFDFSEFISQTPNTLKKWFQSFLDSSKCSLDIIDELENTVKDVIGDHSELTEYVSDCISELSLLDNSDKLLELNAKLKTMLSLKKKQLSDNQSAISKLIYYDDFEDTLSDEEATFKINQIKDKIYRLQLLKSDFDKNSRLEYQLKDYSDLSDCEDTDEIIVSYSGKIENLSSDLENISDELMNIRYKQKDLEASIDSAMRIISSGGICPYTKSDCNSIASMIEDLESECIKNRRYLENLKSEEAAKRSMQSDLSNKVKTLKAHLDSRKLMYQKRDILKSQIIDLSEYSDVDIVSTIENHKYELDRLLEQSSKSKANKMYNDLIDSLTSAKYRIELDIDILKKWIEKTGPNGLQNDLMMNSLSKLESNLNKYISKLFNNDDLACYFDRSSKSNSFSFGIIRNSKYIPYTLLSSGEKCMYLLAFMTCLVDMSDSDIKTIIVDDMLDHLDDDNVKNLFESLSTMHNCQYILAGVKDIYSTYDTLNVIKIKHQRRII